MQQAIYVAGFPEGSNLEIIMQWIQESDVVIVGRQLSTILNELYKFPVF